MLLRLLPILFFIAALKPFYCGNLLISAGVFADNRVGRRRTGSVLHLFPFEIRYFIRLSDFHLTSFLLFECVFQCEQCYSDIIVILGALKCEGFTNRKIAFVNNLTLICLLVQGLARVDKAHGNEPKGRLRFAVHVLT